MLRFDRPPYWHWPLDRWILLGTALLVALALAAGLGGFRGSGPDASTISAPAPGGALLQGKAGDLVGTAAPKAQVRIYDGDKLLGSTQADASGRWKLALPALAAGSHAFRVETLDSRGQPRSTSQPLEVVIRAIPTAALAVSGPAANMTPAAGKPLVLTGSAAPGAKIGLYDGDKLIGSAVAGPDGAWSVGVVALAAGSHSLVVKTLGADGAAAASSQPFTFVVPGAESAATAASSASPLPSATAPAAPSATPLPTATAPTAPSATLLPTDTAQPTATVEPTAAAQPTAAATATSAPMVQATVVAGAPIIGWPPDGSTVGSATPRLAGSASPRATVRILDGAAVIGEAVADSLGQWSLRPEKALQPGPHTVIAVATGLDGQTVFKSASVTFVVPN